MDRYDADVLVLGGGVAGIACAMALRDTGLRSIIAERDEALGGRACSWRDPTTGDPVHIGPHVVTSEYPSFLDLLERLGTADRIVWQERDLVLTLFDGERAIDLRKSPLPPPIQYLASMRRDPALGLADLASNVRATWLALGLDEEGVSRLDALDAKSVLSWCGVRPKMMHRTWALFSMAIMNVPLDRCSAGSILRAYRLAVTRDAPRFGFPACGLGDLFAPARVLLERESHRIETSAAAAALVVEDDRVRGVRFDDGRLMRARHVVSTLPAHELHALVPRQWRSHHAFAHLDWFESVPYVSVHLWLDRKITRRRFWARAYDPRDLNCDFYDFSNIYPGWAHRPSLVASNVIYAHRAAALDDRDIVEATLRELRENIPAARAAAVRHAVVNRIPLAVHAPLPGFESRRPPTVTPVDGLLLAGDWTRTHLPSSMESAAVSGRLAARAIRRREGLALGPPIHLGPQARLARALGATARWSAVAEQAARDIDRHVRGDSR